MPQFKYKARDAQGRLVEAVIIGENEQLIKTQLSEKGLWLVSISTVKEKSSSILDFELDNILGFLNGVGLRDMVVFCRQFSVLVNSGIAMMKTLAILSEQAENPKFRKILTDIKNQVEQGSTLSEAFGKYDNVFDSLFVNMLKAGETGGVLDEVLNRLAGFLEERAKLSAKVKSAMTYPTVVSIFSVIIFFVMLTVVLPQFGALFQQLGSKLPAYTLFLISISEVLRSAWLLVIIVSIVAIVIGCKKFYATEIGKYNVDKVLLKMPVLGPLFQKIAVARFSRTFGTLIKSGVPILTALDIVKEASGNAVIAKAIAAAYKEVEQGGMINQPLEKANVFPPMVISMIAVGEETGQLDLMLTKIANFYDEEVSATVDSLTSLIEPIMMVFLGGMVGAIIVGMYLPMFKIFDAVRQQ